MTSITLLKKLGTRLVDVALNVTTDQRAQLETAVQLVQCMVEEHENRKLVADGEVLMVSYADDCSSLERYEDYVRKWWSATGNDPTQLTKTVMDFLGSPVYKSLLRTTKDTGASGSSGSSSTSRGTKRGSSAAFGGASRAGSSAGSSAGARGGKGKAQLGSAPAEAAARSLLSDPGPRAAEQAMASLPPTRSTARRRARTLHLARVCPLHPARVDRHPQAPPHSLTSSTLPDKYLTPLLNT